MCLLCNKKSRVYSVDILGFSQETLSLKYTGYYKMVAK